ncbi:MAG: S-layer homology domain-containing protein [Clostridia bacterium]|nr:S-layer homology domain-containing protein [Clostridia bacterium]
MKKKLISSILCLILVLAQISVFASPFADVDPVKYSWADKQITKMAEMGIINGYDAQTFAPEDAVRRVDALLLVSRIAGSVANGEEEYLKMAYDTHSTAVSSLGYPSYEETLAYLTYRGIYTESELYNFLKGGAGNSELKRYEAAVILVKLVGAEEEVKLNTMPVLSFDDSAAIPVTAKAYVEYCYEEGLMLGMSETEFSPNTSVTRAQMAVLLEKAMNKLNLTYSRGSVLEVNSVTDSITYTDSNGNTKTINVNTANVPVKYNGEDIMSLDELSIGDKITAIYSGTELIFVESLRVVADSTVTGVYASNSSTPSTKKVTIRPTLTSSETEQYTLAEDCVIYVNNAPATFADMKVDSFLTLQIEDNKVVSIVAEEKTKTVSGTISAFIYDVPSKMQIRLANNTTVDYELSANVNVKRNNQNAEVSELMVGDKVTVTLTYNNISNVVATSTKKVVTGTVEEIVISSTPSITVNTGSTNVECAIDASSIEIYVNGEENSDIYDLRLGDKATLTVESSTVTKIEIETTAVSVDTVNIVGTVQNVDTNYMCITLTVSDGSTQQIFVKKTASILDGTTQKARTLSSIKEGDTITAVITSNGFTQEAISIVILGK